MTHRIFSQLTNCSALGPKLLVVSSLIVFSFAQGTAAQEITEAVKNADTAQVSAMLKKDPALANFIDSNAWSPLRTAALENNAEMIKLLLDHGADIDKTAGGRTALFEAAAQGSVDALKVLLAAGAGVDVRDSHQATPLMTSGGNIEVMTLLLAAGADIDAQGGSGRTTLSQVAHRGRKDAVNLLLKRGAAVETKGGIGRLFVQSAIQHGLTNLLNRLIKGGANIGISSAEGGTMVHLAAMGGSNDIIKMLVDSGVEPGTRDRYGYTPLHYAALNGFPDTVSHLLSKGVKVDPLNAAGQSPLSLAIKYSHEESATVLRDAKAVKDKSEFPRITGDYFGEEPPDGEAKLFALGIVSSRRFEHSTVVFSPDGNEASWSSGFNQPTRGMRILTSKRVDGVWSEPQLTPRPPVDAPFYAPNGKRLYFYANEPIEGEERAFGPGRIWYSERTDEGWSPIIVVDGGPNENRLWWNFSVSNDNDIYFGSNAEEGFGRTDIFFSRYEDGKYLPRENPGPTVNSKGMDVNPYIAPDGSFLLFASDKDGGLGDLDIYVTWRQKDGSWGEARNLGPKVNSATQDGTPILSNDGKYLFFGSYASGNRDNYWIDVASVPALKEP
jgi:ankyrin repeat protein